MPNIINVYRDIFECPHLSVHRNSACQTVPVPPCSTRVVFQEATGSYANDWSRCRYFFLKTGIYRPKQTKMAILNHITSVLRPGRSTLLLGPPAAGTCLP